MLKQILVDSIDNQIAEAQSKGECPKLDIYLSIGLPCGHRAEYETPNDIPEVDIPCSCGNSRHWFIRYENRP